MHCQHILNPVGFWAQHMCACCIGLCSGSLFFVNAGSLAEMEHDAAAWQKQTGDWRAKPVGFSMSYTLQGMNIDQQINHLSKRILR